MKTIEQIIFNYAKMYKTKTALI